MNEKIKTIATWDGWEYSKECRNYTKPMFEACTLQDLHNFYLLDLNWLIPVARKVKALIWIMSKELSTKIQIGDLRYTEMIHDNGVIFFLLNESIWAAPTSNGEYTDLLNAVYDGIMLIEKYKTEQP